MHVEMNEKLGEKGKREDHQTPHYFQYPRPVFYTQRQAPLGYRILSPETLNLPQ
jgi:hypothetical protein